MVSSQTILSLLRPPSSATIPSPPALAEEAERNVQRIQEHFSEENFQLPNAEGSEGKSALSDREMMFLSRETFIRFIIATKGDVAAAITRLENCVVWRRTVDIDNVEPMAEECAEGSDTGKAQVLGFTTDSGPILYMFPMRNATPLEKRKAVHAVYMVERATDLMSDGVGQLVCVFNFAGKRQGPPTSISAARDTLYILASHYPEKLTLLYFVNVHWAIKAFITLMWPFVDPNTKKKVRFCNVEDIAKSGHIPRDVLLKECGGDLDLPYDHLVYWPTLLRKCLERRQAQLEAWREGPRKVGRSESEWKRRSADSEEVPATSGRDTEGGKT